eukprot:scaffold3166_cov399-Prasinococcus_capsulatus_cf.AAC.24
MIWRGCWPNGADGVLSAGLPPSSSREEPARLGLRGCQVRVGLAKPTVRLSRLWDGGASATTGSGPPVLRAACLGDVYREWQRHLS